MSHADYHKCGLSYNDTNPIDIDQATTEIKEICGKDEQCLVDGGRRRRGGQCYCG